jgi:hypothetical protein
MTDTDRATELPSRVVSDGALSTEELMAWGVPADEIDGFLDLTVPFGPTAPVNGSSGASP